MAPPNNTPKLALEVGKEYKVTWKRPDQRRMRFFIAKYEGEDGEGFLKFSHSPVPLRIWWIVQCVPTT